MSRKLKLAFLASIIVNVLLIGVILGHFPRSFDRGSSRQQRMEKALKGLPEPAQSQLREKMERMRADGEPMRDQIRQAHDEAIRILTTEPFDKAAFDRQVDKITELRVQMSKTMARNFKEFARELPSDQRHVLAEMLQPPPAGR
ncbi:MAG TPA: periplasmic heavy metal sensor [Candidatus Binatia bacterium]|nr:periplasmic heavy metal sensor [Candidatus Binatia bacterium]